MAPLSEVSRKARTSEVNATRQSGRESRGRSRRKPICVSAAKRIRRRVRASAIKGSPSVSKVKPTKASVIRAKPTSAISSLLLANLVKFRKTSKTAPSGTQTQKTAPNGTQTQTRPGRDPERQGQSQPGQQSQQSPQQAGRDGTSSVNLSAEQRTRIWSTVLAGNNVPRADNVNFSIRVGTIVPTSVRVVEVPATLIEIYPQWRGHHYFVVQEEIIIVDRDYRIVSVVAVGSGSGAQLDNRGDDRAVGVSMSSEEIRQVQLVLKQKGYAVEVDGVFGPRTRQAVIMFQRREGFQATGEIDQRTSVAPQSKRARQSE